MEKIKFKTKAILAIVAIIMCVSLAVPLLLGVNASSTGSSDESSVTPEMFGAVGDGVADDTAALQSALNTGKSVFLSKTYKVTELDCAGLSKIVMYGKEDVTARLSSFPVANDTYNIIFEGAELFKNAPSKVSLEGIRFYAKNAGILITTKLDGAWIKQCNFTYFGGLFMGGMEKLCQISENVFFQMKGTFATNCVDSIITNNYINSALTARTTLFTGTNFAGMYFQGNFVDYCKTAFGEYANWQYNRIEGNIFDSIFRVFDTKYNFNDTTVTGNDFVRIYYTDFNEGQWGTYADEQMMSEEWTIFYIRGKCNRTNISGNAGEAQATLNFYVNRPNDTHIDLSGVDGEMEFKYSNTSADFVPTIFVKDLDYINVDSLPNAALYNTAGNYRYSFNMQHVVYQNNVYINLNGTWVKMTNNEPQS